jgi:hypothetical protein
MRLGRPLRMLHLILLLAAQFSCCGFLAFLPTSMPGLWETFNAKMNVADARRQLDAHDRECAVLAAPVVAPAENPLQRLLPALVLHRYERPKSRTDLAAAADRLDAVAKARTARSFPATRALVVALEVRDARRFSWPPPQDSITQWHWHWLVWESDLWVTLGLSPLPDPRAWEREPFEVVARHLDRQPQGGHALRRDGGGLWNPLVPVGVCVLAALLTRRGLRSMLLGIDVVRRDGAPAGRIRCAWRVMVAWLPFVAALTLAVWAEETAWLAWTPEGGGGWRMRLADAAWLVAFVIPVASLAAVVWTPARSLHDRLSGTWLVPR